MNVIEKYDPSKPVCNNQDDFNVAMREAINQIAVKDELPWMYVYSIVWFIFLFWALTLALKMPKEQRLIHLIFAIMFSPVYILSYYLNRYAN